MEHIKRSFLTAVKHFLIFLFSFVHLLGEDGFCK